MLKLNFNLESREERLDFLNTQPLEKFNSEDLSTCADYLLYGKGGKTLKEEGIKLRQWAGTSAPTHSLDAMMESSGFTENMFLAPPSKIKRQVFDRAEARLKAPPIVLKSLEELWSSIDQLDYSIQFYENNINFKRHAYSPQISAIAEGWTEEFRTSLETSSLTWTPYLYLKKRRQLIDLRRQQYTLRDSYDEPQTPAFNEIPLEPEDLGFCEFAPCGLANATSPLYSKIFPPSGKMPDPTSFTEADLDNINTLLSTPHNTYAFDFTNKTHITTLYEHYTDLLYDPDPTAQDIIATLNYYEQISNLTPIFLDVLHFKSKKFEKGAAPNTWLQRYILKTYGESYNTNYLSTMYHSICIPSILKAAATHRKVMEQIFFPKEFKYCGLCGQWYPATKEFFNAQGKGLSLRCKFCRHKQYAERKKKKLETI